MIYQMKQCILIKDTTQQTAWIPSKFAILNKVIKLKESPHWKVISISNESKSSKYIDDRSQDYKRTRKYFDI